MSLAESGLIKLSDRRQELETYFKQVSQNEQDKLQGLLLALTV